MSIPPLVDTAWLLANAASVRIVDVRWYLDGRSGRAAYEAGHIAGAVFADLDVDLSAPASTPGGRHPLPTPGDFAAAMSRLGIGDTTTVVAYDDAGGGIAARLWWMLDSIGHPAAVLDGGIDHWTGPIDTGSGPSPAPADFSAVPWPAERFIDADGVADLGEAVVLLDARSADRYDGVPNAVDPRFGHVPGAKSMPWTNNVDQGRMLETAALAARADDLGINPDTEVVAYCGSGVTACNDLLALRLAGRGPGRLYVGSWSDWGADPDRPIETG